MPAEREVVSCSSPTSSTRENGPTDAEILAEYRHQYLVENHTGFRWIKSEGKVSPMFLKTPKRIRAVVLHDPRHASLQSSWHDDDGVGPAFQHGGRQVRRGRANLLNSRSGVGAPWVGKLERRNTLRGCSRDATPSLVKEGRACVLQSADDPTKCVIWEVVGILSVVQGDDAQVVVGSEAVLEAVSCRATSVVAVQQEHDVLGGGEELLLVGGQMHAEERDSGHVELRQAHVRDRPM